MTNYNDGNWHGWNGGECPVHPNKKVQWTREDDYGGTHNAGELVWGDRTGIVAFRAIREPREFWVGDGYCFDSEDAAQLSGVRDVIHVREVME